MGKMDSEQLLFDKGWRDQGRKTLIQKKAWGKDLKQGVGPGVASPVESIGDKLAAKVTAESQHLTQALEKPKAAAKKPGKGKTSGKGRIGPIGVSPSSGYSIKGEDAVYEIVLNKSKKSEGDEMATADQFYVFAEDGVTKLAGPFESEDAAIAEIEKIAAEVTAEVEQPIEQDADVKKSDAVASAVKAIAAAKPAGSTFGDKFWTLVKDAVSLPSWGATSAAAAGGDVVRQASDAADHSTDSVSSGSHIVIQVAPLPGNDKVIGLTTVDGGETADGSDNVQKYAITKSAPEQRYTLGVAYPANRVDVHGDFMTAEDLEKTAWAFFSKADSGTMHAKGTEKSGQVVESYIHRGPAYKSADGDEVRPGDWMLGVVWGQPTWDRIQKGELKGFSFQGFAKRSKSTLA